MNIYGMPQTLSGNEIVTIQQSQNGQLALCSMTLSELMQFILSTGFSALPTSIPSSPGIIWNDNGVISIS